MKRLRRSLVILGVLIMLLAVTVGPTTAELTSWTNFGTGWVNAGYSHDSPVAMPQNGHGNHAGQVRLASSTELDPRRIRIRVVSTDPNPVEVHVTYLWMGCKIEGGGYWSRVMSDQIPEFVPPASFVIYDRRFDGSVEGCHVSVALSTTLFDDGLHHYKVKLQAKHPNN